MSITGEPLTAGCLCSGVRFSIAKPPAFANYCHCTRCQGRSGVAASAQAFVDGESVTFERGEELVRGWRHPDGGSEKCFCSVCGAHLFSREPDTKLIRAVRMSAFDGDPGVRPSFRVFTAYAASWEPIPDDGLERFEESRPG
jgi:hypothetical protein